MNATEARQIEQQAKSIIDTLDKTLDMIRQIVYLQERINWMQAANAKDDAERRRPPSFKIGRWFRRLIRG